MNIEIRRAVPQDADVLTYVATIDERVTGFYWLVLNRPRAVLEDLWLAPEFMGHEVGKVLFAHAIVLHPLMSS